jgi:GH24 family phage-related lysozyme (muramidase)
MIDGAPERLLGPRIKHLSASGFQWLIGLECGKRGPRLRAYRDTRGIPTVGVGQTEIKMNGKWRRVEMTDSFASVEEAEASFAHTVTLY